MDRPARNSVRRFRRRPYRTLVIIVALLVLMALRSLRDDVASPTPGDPLVEGWHSVARVVDGDTIVVGNDSKVRLIGVNTPETVKPDHPVEPFGPEATAFTKRFLAGGTARLEFDRERVDRFGRFLAYVWVGDRMLNEELLRAGLGRWEPTFHYSSDKKDRFKQAQRQAQEEGLGLWSTNGDPRNGPPSQHEEHKQGRNNVPRVRPLAPILPATILPTLVSTRRAVILAAGPIPGAATHRVAASSSKEGRSWPTSNRSPKATTRSRRT